MKKLIIGFLVFLAVYSAYDFLCNSKSDRKSRKEALSDSEKPVVEIEINPLDTSLSYSMYVRDYVPKTIRSEEDLRTYVEQYVEYCDEFYESIDDKLEAMADMAGADLSTGNTSEDEYDKGVRLLKGIGSVRKGFGALASAVWDAKGVLILEQNRKDLLKKYSKTMFDSVLLVEQYLNNYAYYYYVEFLLAEADKMDAHGSLWSLPSSFSADYFEELRFERTRNLLVAFRKDAARVRKILIYNQMNGIETPYLEPELKKLQSFWSNSKVDYETNAKLFNQLSRSIVRLKEDLTDKNEILEVKRELWSEAAIQEMEEHLSRFDDAVLHDIGTLDIYGLPDTDWTLFKEK